MRYPYYVDLVNHTIITMLSDVDSDNEEGASPGQLQKQSSTGTNFRCELVLDIFCVRVLLFCIISPWMLKDDDSHDNKLILSMV